MNGLLWIAQILLAGIFLFTGLTKLFAFDWLMARLHAGPLKSRSGVDRARAVPLGLVEIAGALGVITPEALTPNALMPDYLLVRISAAVLALIMVGAGIYHLRRREPAAPAVSLFLLALFVLVGRWPH